MRLQLSPDAFWAMSLSEWRWLLSTAMGDAPEAMDAAALQTLLQQYPDKIS